MKSDLYIVVDIEIVKCGLEGLKVNCDRVIWLFVMYYIYGRVQAIPTYRVY